MSGHSVIETGLQILVLSIRAVQKLELQESLGSLVRRMVQLTNFVAVWINCTDASALKKSFEQELPFLRTCLFVPNTVCRLSLAYATSCVDAVSTSVTPLYWRGSFLISEPYGRAAERSLIFCSEVSRHHLRLPRLLGGGVMTFVLGSLEISRICLVHCR